MSERELLGWSGERGIYICPTKRRRRSHTVLDGAARKLKLALAHGWSLSLTTVFECLGKSEGFHFNETFQRAVFFFQIFFQGFHGEVGFSRTLSYGSPHFIFLIA